MIKGPFYIFLFYFLGELLSKLIHGFIPGNVLGMVLLFLALHFRILNPENVRSTATIITKNMAIFFVPVAVGLMVYAGFFAKSLAIIILAIGGSTILTILTVGWIYQSFEKKSKSKTEIK